MHTLLDLLVLSRPVIQTWREQAVAMTLHWMSVLGVASDGLDVLYLMPYS